MRRPRISPEEAERFDRALAETPEGGEIAYDLPQPKWVFLHHLLGRGYLLHGSNEGAIDEFRTRATGDAHGKPIDAVFATDDAIWPLYFAVVRREGNTYGYINWCVHVRDESRYLFSIGRDPRAPRHGRRGRSTCSRRHVPADAREPGAGQPRPVRPRAWLRVEPDDFPFRRRTMGHGQGATPSTVTRRAALRRHR